MVADVESEINIPTKTSDLTNDSGYITSSSLPTKTSDLTNDSGFITKTVNNLTNYELKTDTGHSIDLSINSTTYVMTLNLKNSAGTTISTDTVDLPLETMVVSASYDSQTKEIVLTLQSGSTTRFSVADLVSGLQTEITSTNKLSADLVDDSSATHKFVTSSDKTKLSGIETGAQANKIESIKVNGTAQTITSKAVNITVPTKTSDLTNDSNFAVDSSYVHTDNNYTTTEKNKLAGIQSGAEANVNADWNASSGDAQILNKPSIPTKTSDLTNDSGFTSLLRKEAGTYKTKTNLGRYVLCLSQYPLNYSYGVLLPVNAEDNNTGTDKTITTEMFDPFGSIYFYNSTTPLSAGDFIPATSLYSQGIVDLRYSFNLFNATGRPVRIDTPVYLCCEMDIVNGEFYIVGLRNQMPTYEDDKFYIYLGMGINSNEIELSYNHPVYYYSDGEIRLFTNEDRFKPIPNYQIDDLFNTGGGGDDPVV